MATQLCCNGSITKESRAGNYGLGENELEPCSKLITNTNVADGLMCIVNCIDAAAFRVPESKEVSNGIF